MNLMGFSHCQELEEYEKNPNEYIDKERLWFSSEETEETCKAERHWEIFHYLQTKAFKYLIDILGFYDTRLKVDQ